VLQGVSAINDIMTLPLRYTPAFEVSAVVILSIGFAVLFGLSWSEVCYLFIFLVSPCLFGNSLGQVD
jgi:uncharacterized membrane protein YjjP (DUF1212 family)